MGLIHQRSKKQGEARRRQIFFSEETYKTLEFRYGKVEREKADSGVQYVKGWTLLPQERFRGTTKREIISQVDIDFGTGKDNQIGCDLYCGYCFTTQNPEHPRGEGRFKNQTNQRRISQEKMQTTLTELKQDFGLKQVKIVGEGETLDHGKSSRNGWDMLRFIRFTSEELNVPLLIFTSGYDFLIKHPEVKGNTPSDKIDYVIDLLADSHVSIMLKWQHVDPDVERSICQPSNPTWPTIYRDIIMKKMINNPRFVGEELEKKRFGIENVLATSDVPILLAGYKYFLLKGAFYDGDPPMPSGRTASLEEAYKAGMMSKDKLEDLIIGIHLINRQAGLSFEGISPYLGKPRCHQLRDGIYITSKGNILECCGSYNDPLGNIENDSIRNIVKRNNFLAQNMNEEANSQLRYDEKNGYHDCIFRQQRGMLNSTDIDKLEIELKEIGIKKI